MLRTIHRAIFSHLRTNQTASQQVREPSMQTSGNRKVLSLVSEPHEVELPAECFQVVPVFPNVIEHCHAEK